MAKNVHQKKNSNQKTPFIKVVPNGPLIPPLKGFCCENSFAAATRPQSWTAYSINPPKMVKNREKSKNSNQKTALVKVVPNDALIPPLKGFCYGDLT